jgi:hypothetical protein
MGCYLAIMGFQREMICIEKMDLRIRHALLDASAPGGSIDQYARRDFIAY